MSRVQRMRKEEILLDLEIVVNGERKLRAHKLILASVSPFFQLILSNSTNPVQEYEMKNCDEVAVEVLLDYAYCQLCPEDVRLQMKPLEVIDIASRFDVFGLLDFVAEHLTVESAFQALEYSKKNPELRLVFSESSKTMLFAIWKSKLSKLVSESISRSVQAKKESENSIKSESSSRSQSDICVRKTRANWSLIGERKQWLCVSFSKTPQFTTDFGTQRMYLTISSDTDITLTGLALPIEEDQASEFQITIIHIDSGETLLKQNGTTKRLFANESFGTYRINTPIHLSRQDSYITVIVDYYGKPFLQFASSKSVFPKKFVEAKNGKEIAIKQSRLTFIDSEFKTLTFDHLLPQIPKMYFVCGLKARTAEDSQRCKNSCLEVVENGNGNNNYFQSETKVFNPTGFPNLLTSQDYTINWDLIYSTIPVFGK